MYRSQAFEPLWPAQDGSELSTLALRVAINVLSRPACEFQLALRNAEPLIHLATIVAVIVFAVPSLQSRRVAV